ncbi:unnamed protein product [Arctogadus glacialis]
MESGAGAARLLISRAGAPGRGEGLKAGERRVAGPLGAIPPDRAEGHRPRAKVPRAPARATLAGPLGRRGRVPSTVQACLATLLAERDFPRDRGSQGDGPRKGLSRL